MSQLSVVNTFLQGLASQGQLDIWKNGFGIEAPLPDTAALVLQPADLFTDPLITSLTLADLTLDPNSITSIEGLWQVELASDTGLATASMNVSLPLTDGNSPCGAVIYNNSSSDLFYISALPGIQHTGLVSFSWSVTITLGGCLS